MPRWFTIPLIVFIASRLFIFGAGILSEKMLPAESGHWLSAPESPFLSMWAKWDSQDYVDIATNGYWFRPEQKSNVAFFPVYPLLMQQTAPLLGDDIILAGFVISNLAFFGALVYLYLLTELELDAPSAQRAVFYLGLFPTAFFFNCVYTESTFLLFSLATMYFARIHHWTTAALIGMLAAATRNLGVILWALVMWEWLRTQGWSLKTIHIKQSWVDLWKGFREHWFDLIIIAIIPLGILAYMYFLKTNFDRPLAFIETQAAWGRVNTNPLAVIIDSVKMLISTELNKGWLTNFWNTATLLAFLVLTPFIWVKLGEGYAIYVLIMLLVPSTSAMGSIIRYVLAAFPAFMLFGWWGRRVTVDRCLLAGFSLFLGVYVSLFVNWIFVG